jgi:type I restriction enzyme, R subunit
MSDTVAPMRLFAGPNGSGNTTVKNDLGTFWHRDPQPIMSTIGQPERATQKRIIALFRDELGYRFLGDWTDRANSNIEEQLLTNWLAKRGVTAPQISAALYKLRTEADNHHRGLYGNNQAAYNLLRYGVPVKTDLSKPTETVHLIDWHNPEANDFVLAEEVTLKG